MYSLCRTHTYTPAFAVPWLYSLCSSAPCPHTHSDGSVLSEASPELGAVREARRANRDKARQLASQLAKDLYAQVRAALDGCQVTWCISRCSSKCPVIMASSRPVIVIPWRLLAGMHVPVCTLEGACRRHASDAGVPISRVCRVLLRAESLCCSGAATV